MIPTFQLGGLGRSNRVQGGGGGSGVTTLNPSDKAGVIVLTNANLTASKTGADAWTSVRATTHRTTGKRVFEVRLTSGTMDGFGVGLGPLSGSLTVFPGTTAGFYLYHNNGTRTSYSNGSSTFSSGAQVSAGGYVMVCVDDDNGKGWIKTSNVAGYLGGGDPSLGTKPCFVFTPGTDLYPLVTLNHSNNVADVNFVGSFNQTIPVGFVAWDAASEHAAFADTLWPHVALLNRGEGANNSTAFVDATGRHTNATVVGNAKIVTTDSAFPGGAIDTGGSGDRWSWTDSTTDFEFGTGDFCVETTIKFDNLPGGDGAWLFASYQSGFGLYIPSGGGSLAFRQADAQIDSRTFTFATATVYHVAVARKTGTTRFFVNGTKIGTDSATFSGVSVGVATTALEAGEGPSYPTFGFYDGRRRNTRITVGDSRYWADFTPESSPYATV